MATIAQLVGGVLALVGSGLIFVALIRLDNEDRGQIVPGWRSRRDARPEEGSHQQPGRRGLEGYGRPNRPAPVAVRPSSDLTLSRPLITGDLK